MQLVKIGTLQSAEQALHQLSFEAQKQFKACAHRNKQLNVFLPTFNLSFVAPAHLKSADGWHSAWNDHVVVLSENDIAAIDEAVQRSVKAEKAVAKLSQNVVLDWGPDADDVDS